MSGPNEAQSTSPSAFELKLSWTSRQLALAGGYLVLGLAMMTVISIIGRTFFAKPVSGDYELVQIGLAISVFFFLPECHLRKGHVVVDFFTSRASKKTLSLLSAISEILFFVTSVLFVWRLAVGTYEAVEYAEKTMILELPYWVAYLCGTVTMLLIALNSMVHFKSDISELRQ
jgi:TRAP-type C4-dicarboxylate transport system permease small subunit